MCQIGQRLGMSLGEVGRMDADELATWMAFFKMEEGRDREADWRAGMIAATVANCMTTGRRVWTPEDFKPVGESNGAMHPDEYLKARRAQWERQQRSKGNGQ